MSKGTGLNGLSDLDHVALSRLLVEKMWRIDHGLADTIYELYTEDGEIRWDGKLLCKGHDALRQWGSDRGNPGTARHSATNLRFEADGPGRASGSSVFVAYFGAEEQQGPEATVPLLVEECDLQCVRQDSGWRFVSTSYRVLFERREEP
jgi:hypothetical protein